MLFFSAHLSNLAGQIEDFKMVFLKTVNLDFYLLEMPHLQLKNFLSQAYISENYYLSKIILGYYF